MNKTKAPAPSPKGGIVNQNTSTPASSKSPSSEFIGAALSMSWQLAIVVLVPIIGGFELDKALNMSPVFFILGFIIAMAGMAAVVWHQVQILTPTTDTDEGKS